MASRRMVPTRFFKDPDIMNLRSKDAQLILIGLVLTADDEGREVAHAGLLGREMDYAEEQVEAALAELAENDLLMLYQAGKHRYYQLTRWNQWQTLGNKKTPSKYPAPCEAGIVQETLASECSSIPQETAGTSQETRENAGERSSQLNLIESTIAVGEEKRTEQPSTESQPGNILPFPTRADGGQGKAEEITVKTLAQVLHLPVTSALARLVTEFQHVPGLSLLGEADAARAWVDDQRGKRHQHTQMTLPFFRRWLQRSLTIHAQHSAQAALETHQATGTVGRAGPARLPDLMHLDDDLQQQEVCR